MNTQDSTQQTHTLNDLRGHLMATLAGLRDKQNPMPVEVARAMAQVGSVMVDTAKVEVDYIRATKGRTSAFMAANAATPTAPRQHPAALAGYGAPRTTATDVPASTTANTETDTITIQATHTAGAPDPQNPPAGPAAIQSVWRHGMRPALTEDERGVAR